MRERRAAGRAPARDTAAARVVAMGAPMAPMAAVAAVVAVMVVMVVMVVVMVVMVGACGAAAGEGGGATDLPSRAAGPYGELPPDPETPLDEPTVLADPQEEEAWRAPAVCEAGAGRYTVLFAAQDATGRTEIRRADDVDLTAGAARVSPVLEPQQSWEASRVDHPALLEPGCGHAFGLLYEGGAGAIGYAGSEDGEVFVRAAEEPLLTATLAAEGSRVGRPAAVWVGETLHLYYAAPDVEAIFLARVTCTPQMQVEKVDADPRTPEHDPVLGPNSFAETFDRGGVDAPFVRVTSFADRPVFDLWYAGHDGAGTWAVGFAGSQDGLVFKRFAENPALPAAGVAKRDPVVVPRGVGAVMFFSRLASRGPSGIAAAIHE